MKIVASACKVKGEKVAIVTVQTSVLDHSVEADRYIQHLAPVFEGAEVVLYGDDGSGKARYYGRGDLLEALGDISPESIPWQEYEADL